MKKLILRKFKDEDITLFVAWLNEAHVQRWFENRESWIEELDHRNDSFGFICHFIAIADDEPIGFCRYYEYALGGEMWHGDSDITDTYSIDYLIGNSLYLRQGYASRMIGEMEKEIISQTKARNIIVQPEVENTASRALLLKNNYNYDKERDLFFKNLKQQLF